MSEPKWTKGEWCVAGAGRMASFQVKTNIRSVAAVWGRASGRTRVTAESEAEGLANARLIAAAPNLYEALTNILAAEQRADVGIFSSDVIEKAETALAKARGEKS